MGPWEVVSEGDQHCDEAVAPVREGENAEFVEDGGYIGDGREQPVEVTLIDTLREEGNDSKKVSRVRAKPFEHGGVEREFDCSTKALVVFRLKDSRVTFVPLLGQSIVVPPVLVCDGGQQGDRQRMEVELPQYAVDRV